MKHLIFVHSLLSLIVAAVLLVIAALGCAVPAAALSSGAGALIRAEWEQIVDGEALPWVYTLASDDHTLYAGGRGGLYISEDDGHVWRQLWNPVCALSQLARMTCMRVRPITVYFALPTAVTHGSAKT